jgi:hypothetical protein
MVKVRLRNKGPTPRIGTRGEMNALKKENKIIRIYAGGIDANGVDHPAYGAKLVEAHGALRRTNNNNSNYKTVPKDTVIIFLSQFGQCMALMGARTLANEYFRTDAGMRKFFRGEAGMAGRHHGEILSRTKFHGQKYPDVYLEFYDEEPGRAGFGWVWSLPTTYKLPENFSPHVPRGNQVINQSIHGEAMRLSEVIARLGKGVYIISACLVAQNQVISNYTKIPYNLPSQYRAQPAKRRTRNAAAFAESIFKKQPLRPGSFARRTAFAPKTGKIYKGPPKIRIAEVLTQLGRRPSRVNLKSKFPFMRANVNQNRLLRVQKILQNPTNFVSKLSQANRNAWNKLSAINKGAFVNARMNAPTNNRSNTNLNMNMNTNNYKPSYYFRVKWPNTNKPAWFNSNGRKINQPANVNESKLVPYNAWTININQVANKAGINAFFNNYSGRTWHAYAKYNH